MPTRSQTAPESPSPLFRRGEERSDEGQSPIYQKKARLGLFTLFSNHFVK